MPAPRPEYRDNPLRRLRMILAGSDQKPMHQEEFSRLTGVPVAVVRALERGVRGQMSFENCLDRIGHSTGAMFSTRDGQWHFLGSKHLYEHRHFLAFTQLRAARFKNYCLHALILRMMELFKAVSPKRWFGMFLSLMSTLEETAHRFEIKGRSSILENTKPRWGIAKTVSVDGVLVDPATPPRIVSHIHCFGAKEISDPRSEDDETLLDFRQYRE